MNRTSVMHWIWSDGRGWFIPHGRITLNLGTEDERAVTCKVCRRILRATCRCHHRVRIPAGKQTVEAGGVSHSANAGCYAIPEGAK